MLEKNDCTSLMQQDGLFKAIRIEAEKPGPRVLITAGVHGDEYEPMMAAAALVKKINKLLIAGEVTIIPMVNEAAFRRKSRIAGDGLDLARICPGNLNGSISERVAAQVSTYIKAADFYIDMHTGGQIFDIYPLAGYMLHTCSDVLDKQRAMAKAFNLPVIWATDSTPNGRTLSVARDANVPAIYIEYGGGEALKQDVVEAYEKGCLNVLSSLGMLASRGDLGSLVQYIVEDYTPDNGYLQGKLPAPRQGFFIPLVEVGQNVRKGDLWGHIASVPDVDRIDVFADIDGVALFLRKSVFVEEGDSLGGILPISKPGKSIINGNK